MMNDPFTPNPAEAKARSGMITVDVPESAYHLFNINYERGPVTDEEFARYTADNRYSLSVNADLYPLPEQFLDQGAPRGDFTAGVLGHSLVFPGTEHRYWRYVPAAYDPEKPANFALIFDGSFFTREAYPGICLLFDNLIASGDIPPTVVLFLDFGVPGPGQPVLGFNEGEVDRSLEYDTPTDANARFVVEEAMPTALRGLNISPSPADRMVMGISSSGIAAFSTAWFRPEAFGKVYMASASFVNIRCGVIWPSVIRMSEKKDLSVFAVVGKHDLNNLFGNWLYSNLEVGSALHFRGYDSALYLSEAGHSFNVYLYMMPRALTRLFGGRDSAMENIEAVDFSRQIGIS